jgi:hypothetical protein
MTVIALALGTTTITTTMQIQPAYSQASHCAGREGFERCVTPGQNPSIARCDDFFCESNPIDPQFAGRLIGGCHQTGECTVTKELPTGGPPPPPP